MDYDENDDENDDDDIDELESDKPIKYLMLGVIYRFAPYQSGNFMPKWVEITSEGITYFKSSTSDKAQGFFPKHVIKDVTCPVTIPSYVKLLSKLRRGT